MLWCRIKSNILCGSRKVQRYCYHRFFSTYFCYEKKLVFKENFGFTINNLTHCSQCFLMHTKFLKNRFVPKMRYMAVKYTSAIPKRMVRPLTLSNTRCKQMVVTVFGYRWLL